jgi:hypothetical protein
MVLLEPTDAKNSGELSRISTRAIARAKKPDVLDAAMASLLQQYRENEPGECR